jgi:diguanylate cyclase (GGDEF)-like protein
MYADYRRKYNTDNFQRRLFFRVLNFALTAITADFIFTGINGQGGKFLPWLLRADLTVFYFFQIASYFFIFVFLDYLASRDHGRAQKITRIVWTILSLHGLILILNLFFGFYFDISPENTRVYGNAYGIRAIFAYTAVLLAIASLCFSRKKFKKSQLLLIIFFFMLNSAGAVLGHISGNGTIIWPCFSSGLLYGYFFIIKAESKTDNLTGIGNRYSFNEFVDRLSKSKGRRSYTIVMIDVDHFKRINDTLGHAEGDNALRDLAAIIKTSAGGGFAARYGGDEFVLAIKKEEEVKKLLDRIQQGITAHNEKNTRPYKLQISYGYDTFTAGSGQNIKDFLTHIDNLMYKHKAERRRSTDS